jgi:hypothetical protein
MLRRSKLWRITLILSTLGLVFGSLLVHGAASAAPRTAPPAAPAPGPWQTMPNCEQPPDQSVKDRALYTADEMNRYGIPQRAAGESYDKWVTIVRGLKTRVCEYRDTGHVAHGLNTSSAQHRSNAAGDAGLETWAGNIVDEPVGGGANYEVTHSTWNNYYYYTEIDSD